MKKNSSNTARIEDVAAAAGVSIMSVSRAMRGVEGISQRKREEILRIARRIGYYPNSVAVSLAASSSNLIGVSVPTLFGTVFAEIYDAMRPTLEKAGYATMIDITDYSESHEEQWVERMIAWRPAGLIISGVDHSEATRRLLSAAKIPVLEIWEYTANPIDLCVGIDHFQSGELMGNYLVSCGYRKPAYVGVKSGKDLRADRRLAGMAKAFQDNDTYFIALDRNAPSTSFESGMLATDRLLSSATERPDVICYLHDNMAFGGLMSCERHRIDCPKDIGIVGYNDLNINTVLPKRITTTTTSRTQMGEMGARLLVAKILGAKTTNATKIEVTIAPGETTLAPAI